MYTAMVTHFSECIKGPARLFVILLLLSTFLIFFDGYLGSSLLMPDNNIGIIDIRPTDPPDGVLRLEDYYALQKIETYISQEKLYAQSVNETYFQFHETKKIDHCRATIVTALFVDGVNDKVKYHAIMDVVDHLLVLPVCMVFFVSAYDSFVARAKEIRSAVRVPDGHGNEYGVPSVIVEMDMENLEYYQQFLSQKTKIWLNQSSNETRARFNYTMEGVGPNPFGCTAWGNKNRFLSRVATRNPFGSKYFVWMDAGFFRQGRWTVNQWWDRYMKELAQFRVDNLTQFEFWPHRSRLRLLDDDKLHLMDVRQSMRNGSCELYLHLEKGIAASSQRGLWVAGGGFAGTKKAILIFDSLVTMGQFDAWSAGKNGCYDQGIWAHVACRNPELFTFVKHAHIGPVHFRQILLYLDGSQKNDSTYTFVLT